MTLSRENQRHPKFSHVFLAGVLRLMLASYFSSAQLEVTQALRVTLLSSSGCCPQMLQTQDSISQPLLLSLERRLGHQAFDTWFRPLKVTKSPTERVLQILAPNAVVRDGIIAHYADVLKDSLGEHQLGQYRIEWCLGIGESRDRLKRNPIGIQSPEDVRVAPSTVADAETRLFVETTPRALRERYTFPGFLVA